eukprot:363892-Chlamydomonas_euryale.AAC.3
MNGRMDGWIEEDGSFPPGSYQHPTLETLRAPGPGWDSPGGGRAGSGATRFCGQPEHPWLSVAASGPMAWRVQACRKLAGNWKEPGTDTHASGARIRHSVPRAPARGQHGASESSN